ncbi:uncharacterized protein LACBIDRAFT_308214 [Laccaria bicolor S238N-H82]|uniref:Predicted protein n=1 Tax=Laccaria bicolor (strain S238N-H82 / ATCC MYA-4686) TaxID=486041 RepID=B0DRV1_LACBS|nr:uncharacterized protein LACBIDRAFT_308214 [Laccaria bicolor S238N-H82]EDR02676.1 predicted protein [Laccaria bicolor S238N-H82]|eukprot:XP_001886720.1 predicted protein [Laccaria bicolor S238N-H82]
MMDFLRYVFRYFGPPEPDEAQSKRAVSTVKKFQDLIPVYSMDGISKSCNIKYFLISWTVLGRLLRYIEGGIGEEKVASPNKAACASPLIEIMDLD